MTISRFVSLDNSHTYTFPTHVEQTFNTNFKNLLQRSTRLPGADGGIRDIGIGRAPSPVGNVQVDTYLVSSTRTGMQALRDSLNAMANWGMGRLFDTYPDGSERWAWCAVSTIDMSEERRAHTDLWQPVKLNFEAPDPFWYTTGNELLWGDGSKWGAGGSVKWGGTSALTAVSGSGDITVTNNGNATTLARIYIKATTTCYKIRVARIVNLVETDWVTWAADGLALLPPNWYISLNPRKHRAILVASGAVTNTISYVRYNHPDWMRLPPGTNTIRVSMESGSVSAGIFYLERYT